MVAGGTSQVSDNTHPNGHQRALSDNERTDWFMSKATYNRPFRGCRRRVALRAHFAQVEIHLWARQLETAGQSPPAQRRRCRGRSAGGRGLEHGSFIRRFADALGRIVITRTDAGAKQVNYSEFFGDAAAAGISNAYIPVQDRTVGATFQKVHSAAGDGRVLQLAEGVLAGHP
jgi:hypothetical protein